MLAELGEPAAGSLFDGVLARGAVRGIFSDVSWLQAMLDAEAALSRAQGRCRPVACGVRRSDRRGMPRR